MLYKILVRWSFYVEAGLETSVQLIGNTFGFLIEIFTILFNFCIALVLTPIWLPLFVIGYISSRLRERNAIN